MNELGEAWHICDMRIRATQVEEDPATLPIQVYLKGAEMVQHGQVETRTDYASDIDPTIRHIFFLYKD